MFVNGVWKPTRVGTFRLNRNSCQALFDLRVVEPVVADVGREEGVEIREGLRAGRFALHRVEEVDDLSERCPQVPGRRALRFAFDSFEPGRQ